MSAITNSIFGQSVERAEPLSWWVGMNTPLQIMFHGKDLSGSEVTVVERGVTIKKVHGAHSPNYLFVDVEVSPDAKAGDYTFQFAKGKKKTAYKYRIDERRAGSAQREGYNSADVVYLVMPDRFVNGDPTNDNSSLMAEKADRKNPHGRHGGDIQGIINSLDYMKDLGITALWSTPLTHDNEPEYSYHGYACSDYYRIDPRYGDNNLYKKMVAEAHKRGIKVVKDMVPNHCGITHWWMADLPFEDWVNPHTGTFTNHAKGVMFDPNASKSDLEACVNGWFDTMMPDLNIKNPYMLNYLTQMAVWWVEWADLDALRVDTYPYNDRQGIAAWTKAVMDEYPNLNIVGECWTGSHSMVAYWDGASQNKDGYTSYLPSVMDFPLQEAWVAALSDTEEGWGKGMVRVYDCLSHDFLYPDPRKLMIFLDNHDTDRFASKVKEDTKKMCLGVTMLATMRGVPQMFYGTELMISGNPEHGDGGKRVDFPGGWAEDKVNLFDTKQLSADQKIVFDHTRKLLNWRKTAQVIHTGKTMHFIDRDNRYVYFRYDDNQVVMVFVNGSDEAKSVDWARYAEITDGLPDGVDVISDKTVSVGEPLTVDPMSSIVVTFKK